MDLAKYSITHRVVAWMFVVILIGGGLHAYQVLSRYEDPEFTIKEALVYTAYPGATPQQVEEEVTEKITEAIQQMSQIKRLEGISRPELSRIKVIIKDQFTKHQLPQVWDELRNKVGDIQSKLPPGASQSLVIDDYGDVFGILFALTGDGYSPKELRDYAKEIKKQLLLVEGVAKVTLEGIEQEAIFIELSREKIASLGISLESIYRLLASQNLIIDSGQVRVGDEYIDLLPSGIIEIVEDIGNLLIPSKKTSGLIYLSDIAQIFSGYQEVPKTLSFYNGKPTIMVGVSIVSGGECCCYRRKANSQSRLHFSTPSSWHHLSLDL